MAGIGDCMERHLEVLENNGFCWFGKLGTAPSESSIEKKIGNMPITIILYSQGKTHICSCSEITSSKPKNGYPKYYDKYLINRGMEPSVYFKLTSIAEFAPDDFNRCVSLKSGRKLNETVHRSMASFFYGIYTDEGFTPIEDVIQTHKYKSLTNNTGVGKRSKGLKMDLNSCKYRENGLCTCKSSINYTYECDRPSSCLKQKPLPMER